MQPEGLTKVERLIGKLLHLKLRHNDLHLKAKSVWKQNKNILPRHSNIHTCTHINIKCCFDAKEIQGGKHLSLGYYTSLVAQTVKCLPSVWETWVWSLGREDPVEKEMATHSSTLAWKIPWTEEPDRLQSIRSQRVGCGWATSLSLSLSHTN